MILRKESNGKGKQLRAIERKSTASNLNYSKEGCGAALSSRLSCHPLSFFPSRSIPAKFRRRKGTNVAEKQRRTPCQGTAGRHTGGTRNPSHQACCCSSLMSADPIRIRAAKVTKVEALSSSCGGTHSCARRPFAEGWGSTGRYRWNWSILPHPVTASHAGKQAKVVSSASHHDDRDSRIDATFPLRSSTGRTSSVPIPCPSHKIGRAHV